VTPVGGLVAGLLALGWVTHWVPILVMGIGVGLVTR
jgi:hypothetical protein